MVGAECDLLVANPQNRVVLGIFSRAEVDKSLVNLKGVLVRVKGSRFLAVLQGTLNLHEDSDVLTQVRIGIEHVPLQTSIHPPRHSAETRVVPIVPAFPNLAS